MPRRSVRRLAIAVGALVLDQWSLQTAVVPIQRLQTLVAYVMSQASRTGRYFFRLGGGACACNVRRPRVQARSEGSRTPGVSWGLTLRPLRVVVLACAALLVAAAASLVGWLHDPYMSWLWGAGAWTTTAMSVVMLVPILGKSVGRVR